MGPRSATQYAIDCSWVNAKLRCDSTWSGAIAAQMVNDAYRIIGQARLAMTFSARSPFGVRIGATMRPTRKSFRVQLRTMSGALSSTPLGMAVGHIARVVCQEQVPAPPVLYASDRVGADIIGQYARWQIASVCNGLAAMQRLARRQFPRNAVGAPGESRYSNQAICQVWRSLATPNPQKMPVRGCASFGEKSCAEGRGIIEEHATSNVVCHAPGGGNRAGALVCPDFTAFMVRAA